MRIAMVSEHASPLAAHRRRRRRRPERARRRAVGGPGARAATRSRSTPAATRPRCRDGSRLATATRRARRRRPAGGAAQGRPAARTCGEFAASARPGLARRPARRRARALLDERARGARAGAAARTCRSCRRSTRSAVVKRRHQGAARHQPAATGSASRPGSPARSDRVVATCSDEVVELRGAGRAGAAHLGRARAASTSTHSRPDGPARRAQLGRRRLLTVGRLVERKGVDDADPRAGPACRTPSCVVAGGPPPEQLDDRPGGAAAARASPLRARGRRPASCCSAGVVAASDMPALLRSADVGRLPSPGTSRSASCRSRRWRAAARWSPSPSAACSTRSSTASPACSSRPATRRARRAAERAARRRRALRPASARPEPAGPQPRTAGTASRPTPHAVVPGGRLARRRSTWPVPTTGASAADELGDGGHRLTDTAAAHGTSRRADRGAAPLRAARRAPLDAGAASWPRLLLGRRPAARRRQRWQRRAGAAPHRRAGRPLPRRPAGRSRRSA